MQSRNRIMAAALAVLSASASAAAAEGIDWGLLQPPPNFVDSYQHGYELGRKMAAERTAERQAAADQLHAEAARAAEQDAERLKQARAQSAGRMIAADRCQEARSYALDQGDLDLALQVAKLCPFAPRQ
jgi:hypothetical protein